MTDSLRNKLLQARKLIDEALSELNPIPTAARKLISPTDFQYIGSAIMPKQALDSSTGYSAGLLAMRKVNGKPQFFTDGHIYLGGSLYEFTLPELRKEAPFNTVNVIKPWGDIYGDCKHDSTGLRSGVVNGLRWDEEWQALIWTYGINYATEDKATESLGWTRMSGSVSKPIKSFKVLREKEELKSYTEAINAHWRRGGTVEIPKWFAEKYTDGKTLGVGFGGYYSIIEGGSAGPCLIAVHKEGLKSDFSTISGETLMGYPWSSGSRFNNQHCLRPADYTVSDTGWLGANGGYWTAADEIGGENHAAGAVWIDEQDKQGLLLWSSQGLGNIKYSDGQVRCGMRANRLYVVDPQELAEVALGSKESWRVKPKFFPWGVPGNGHLRGTVGGVAFDKETRMLYVMVTEAWQDGPEAFPAIHAYRLT